jgi:hypothetical protein
LYHLYFKSSIFTWPVYLWKVQFIDTVNGDILKSGLSANLSVNSILAPFFEVIYLKAEGVIAFLNRCSLDEMGMRIDELEQSINDLKAEMGSDGVTTLSKTKDEGSKPADSSAWTQDSRSRWFVSYTNAVLVS